MCVCVGFFFFFISDGPKLTTPVYLLPTGIHKTLDLLFQSILIPILLQIYFWIKREET